MKSRFLIVFMTFIITVSSAQGLKFLFRKKCSHSKNIACGNPIVLDGNKTYFYIEDRPIKPKRTLGPTVVRKSKNCICKLPICECSRSDDPEKWYVKTFLRGNTRMTPVQYSVKPFNLTAEIFNCLEELKKLKDDLKAKEKTENSWKSKLCPIEKKPQCGNKWLFGCPPLINLSKKKNCFQSVSPKRDLKIQTHCLECKLQQSQEDKSKVLLKCRQCGPVHSNAKNEKINFSNLILKRKNKLKLHVKFIQVTHKTK